MHDTYYIISQIINKESQVLETESDTNKYWTSDGRK